MSWYNEQKYKEFKKDLVHIQDQTSYELEFYQDGLLLDKDDLNDDLEKILKKDLDEHYFELEEKIKKIAYIDTLLMISQIAKIRKIGKKRD